ncbi:MAG: dTMP kinase [Candidatus Altiarchaeota archaeon]
MSGNKYTSMFIVLEGIDGCGKTTQARKLADWLRGQQKQAFLTMEPTGGKIGVFLRQILAGEEKVDPQTLALLFTADRVEHLRTEVEPALAQGKIVISERYAHSTIAYQAAQGVDRDWIMSINSFAPNPDVTFYLDVDPTMGAGRSDRAEIFENAAFLAKVREEYLRMTDYLTVVDASKTADEVFLEIKSKLSQALADQANPVEKAED